MTQPAFLVPKSW